MYNLPIVPEDFEVPQLLETARMRLRCLSIDDVDKNFEAVMSSEHRLKTVFKPGAQWPTGLTKEQNTIELGWHQTEFQLRTSFAYTVVRLNENSVLGCLYIYPSRRGDYDVEILMWVRESEAQTGLDQHLFDTVHSWVASEWPFVNPAYPGRTISWEEWCLM